MFLPNHVFANYCGDGLLKAPEEECDDGNYVDRDGCSSYCKLEDMTPPTVTYSSIAIDATNVSTITDSIRLHFSEPVDPDSINAYNVKVKQESTEFKIEMALSANGLELTITMKQDFFGEAKHAIVIDKVKDLAGNMMNPKYVGYFTTGVAVDRTAPTVVARPAGGIYSYAQSVTLTPYLTEITYSDDYIDKDAIIYYTINGAIPTTKSPVFENDITIRTNTTLRYMAVDKKGNQGAVVTQVYNFDCPANANAINVTPYPACTILECNIGFRLQSNVCVMSVTDESDYKALAATAPLFSSNTPMTISTKPALYITPEHEGFIPRPINFTDSKTGTTISFLKDSTIRTEDGATFTGYIIPPKTLFTKDYPLNFGYTFLSIFRFEEADGRTLLFSPYYKITVPFSDRYDEDAEITVFTFDPETGIYSQMDPSLYAVNEGLKEVTIIGLKTDTFFIAQTGKGYNAAVFKDAEHHWAQYYIELLYRKGIVKGKAEGIYGPNDPLTRAEFTKIALNAIGETVDPLEDVKTAPFSDVALYAWYVPYVKKAKELGLINGYPDGTFKPDSEINRAEAIKILLSALGFDLSTAGQRDDEYQDIYTDQWYFPAVNFAIANKLLDGIRLPDGRIMTEAFGPGRSISRAEMAVLAIRALDLKEAE